MELTSQQKRSTGKVRSLNVGFCGKVVNNNILLAVDNSLINLMLEKQFNFAQTDELFLQTEAKELPTTSKILKPLYRTWLQQIQTASLDVCTSIG